MELAASTSFAADFFNLANRCQHQIWAAPLKVSRSCWVRLLFQISPQNFLFCTSLSLTNTHRSSDRLKRPVEVPFPLVLILSLSWDSSSVLAKNERRDLAVETYRESCQIAYPAGGNFSIKYAAGRIYSVVAQATMDTLRV